MKAVLFALIILLSPAAAFGTDIRLVTEEFKPYQYPDANGRPVGFGIELVSAMFHAAGVPIRDGRIEILPWIRAYTLLQNEANTAAFMTVRNRKREKKFHWVGPLSPREMFLFKLKSRTDIVAPTLEHARRYTIGGYRSAQTDYLQELGFPSIHFVDREGQTIHLLLLGRVDMIPSLEMTIRSRLDELGKSPDIVEKVVVFDHRFDYYLALNKKTPHAIVNRLQKALDRLRIDGTVDKIRNRYLEPGGAP